MQPYKYYSGITSQVGFCATPLRLDPYNKCQFSCDYCFASTRQGFGRDNKIQVGNPDSLERRLNRVYQGKIASALDELISRKIPFQLGGMSDPFTKIEDRNKITLEYLKILKKYNYPVIVSTKSDKIAKDEYLKVISGSNIYVRFSTTVLSSDKRSKVDRGCPPLHKIAESASILSQENIPTSFRFQPIIPGFEVHFEELLSLADSANVKHISAEYLKCPIDSNVKFGAELQKILGNNPIKYYKELGATKQGREFLLPASYRVENLASLAKTTRSLGMSFGFADNDFLIHSDGNSCCAASNLYLKEASFFEANIVYLAKTKSIGEKIHFEDYLKGWVPVKAISTYLNSKARLSIIDTTIPEWLNYLKKMWLGKQGVFCPSYFDGIESTNEFDDNGLPIYLRTKSRFHAIQEINSNMITSTNVA